jgi:hypothetical protein
MSLFPGRSFPSVRLAKPGPPRSRITAVSSHANPSSTYRAKKNTGTRAVRFKGLMREPKPKLEPKLEPETLLTPPPLPKNGLER